MYALATLLSASVLIVVGQKIDYVPLKGFSLFAIIGMIAASLVAALSYHVFMLFVALFMLRFFGQGLLSHTAMTTMSRYFKKARGKALSIAYLGFPAGEGLLPVLVVSLIMVIGWRETFGVTALLMIIILLPLAVFLLKGVSIEHIVEETDKTVYKQRIDNPEEARIWRKREVLNHPLFYLYAPTVFLIGFLQTALFFFQTFIAAEKGWSVEWMAGSIMAYAIASSILSIGAGPLIDRFSASRIFPFILIPLSFGLLVLSYASHPFLTPVFWLLIGVSGGVSSPVSSSLYAETFGTKSLGTVRSLFTFVMVMSTALGPIVYSLLLDRGLTFMAIHWGVIVVIMLNVVFILALSRSFRSKGK